MIKDRIKQLILNDGYYRERIIREFGISRSDAKKLILDLGLNSESMANGRQVGNDNFINANRNKREVWLTKLDIPSIINDINSGLGHVELIKVYSSYELTEKKCRTLAKMHNMYDKLKENNNNYKSRILRYYGTTRRMNEVEKYIQLYGSGIGELIQAGAILDEIQTKFNIPIKALHRVIDQLGLTDRRKLNSLQHKKAIQIARGLKGAQKTKGTTFMRNEVTDEIRDYFCIMKDNGILYSRAKKQMKTRFAVGGKNIWNYLEDTYGKLNRSGGKSIGKLNGMYGKSPPWRSGVGIKCHFIYNGIEMLCRSSLELRIFIYLYDNNIEYKLSNHRIKYIDDNKQKTYNPDIVFDSVIYEIKPNAKLNWKDTKIKAEALTEYCKLYNLNWNYITESTYDISYIDIKYIDKLISGNIIKINDKQYERLNRASKLWKKEQLKLQK